MTSPEDRAESWSKRIAKLKEMHDLIKIDDAQGIENLLEEGIKLYDQIKSKSLLSLAAEYNAKNAVNLLIARGANVNFGGKSGTFPLYMAVKKRCSIGILNKLLEAGADINYRYVNGDTPLLEAAWVGDLEKVKILVEEGSDIMTSNNGGDTPLHMAALSGNYELAKYLLDLGMPVDVLKRGRGPLKYTSTDIQPLHMTSYGQNGGHAHVAELLIGAGANIDARMTNGRTLLHLAAIRNATVVADLLLSHKCDLNILSEENDEHKTALMHAINGGNISMVEKLVNAGADMEIPDQWGLTPLAASAFIGSSDMARCLILAGANLNTKSTNGVTPFTASLRQPPHITWMLVMAGCQLPQLHLLKLQLQNETLTINKYPQIVDMLLSVVENVQTLQMSCRGVLRQSLGPHCEQKINKLPIAPGLKTYIHYSDIINFDAYRTLNLI